MFPATDLGYEIVSELGVLGHSTWNVEGKEINESLDFMDHSICVWHLAPVCHAGASVSAHHTVNLLVNFLCWGISKLNGCFPKPFLTVAARLSYHPPKNTGTYSVVMALCWK